MGSQARRFAERGWPAPTRSRLRERGGRPLLGARLSGRKLDHDSTGGLLDQGNLARQALGERVAGEDGLSRSRLLRSVRNSMVVDGHGRSLTGERVGAACGGEQAT